MKTHRYKVLLPTYFRHQRFDPDKSGEEGVVEVSVDEENPAPATFLPLDGGPVDDVELSENTLAVIERKKAQYLRSNVVPAYEPKSYSEMQAGSKAAIPVGSDKAFEDSQKFTKKKKSARRSSSSSGSSSDGAV